MSAEISGAARERRAAFHCAIQDSDPDRLSQLAIAAGLACAVSFVVVGLAFRLQMYGDGSIFSYSVAVRDVWAFHWHNIPGRLSVYVLAMLPAETYVAWFKDPQGGIVLYGELFFGIQLASLAATYFADRSRRRIVFRYACLSTACLCPLVFGFPTEMWFAHALFWPTLALCHYAPPSNAGAAAIFTAVLALVFTHPGAIVFALTILFTFLLRTDRAAGGPRMLWTVAIVIALWTAVKLACPPDEYCAAVLARAARLVFDPEILTGDMVKLLGGTLAAYGILVLLIRRLDPARAHVAAAAAVAAGLATYWCWFDHALHAENRYYLRTAVLIATPGLGLMAAAYAFHADGRLAADRVLARPMTLLAGRAPRRAAIGAFALLLLVHAVETAKFTWGWSHYKAAIHALANGALSDPALGNPNFVSSIRIGADLNRLSWFSTTHFLSVLLAPNLSPARLVVDPTANYFWLACQTAQSNLDAERVVPSSTRRLVRVHACLNRR